MFLNNLKSEQWNKYEAKKENKEHVTKEMHRLN